MEIITGYTGENHVTSADDASLYRGILGADDYVLEVGNKFAATIVDNNTVRIMDGDLVIQGHQARIRANDYNEVTIDNGTPGQKRNDLIVARYQKNTTTGIESITLEVVKGTPGTTATDPEIIQEDLKVGGTQRDFPLYRVSIDGINLQSVTSLFNVIPNLAAFKSHLAESANKHITESGSNDDGSYMKFDDGTLICTYKSNITWGDAVTRFGFIETSHLGIAGQGKMWSGSWLSPPIPFVGDYIILAGGGRTTDLLSYTVVSEISGAGSLGVAVVGNVSTNTTLIFALFGIGRWK